jgi:hypothetical protein
MVPFTLSGENLVFTVDGKPYKISRHDRNFKAVAQGINSGKTEKEVLQLFNKGVNVTDYLKDNERVTFDGQNVYIDGEVLHDVIVDRIRKIAELGLPVEQLLKFISNIHKNPSFNSRAQLYGFLEHGDIAITDDGCFIAYKAVRNDYKDKYSGKFDNSVTGVPIVMDRSKIDDNPNNHCSSGLHVGSIKYAGVGGYYHDGGDRTMLVKVNPKDVVSVPNDHSCQKCRVCEYLVIGEVDSPLQETLYTADGEPYPVQFADTKEYECFDYDEDDDYDSDIYDYDEEDDYDDIIGLDEDDLPPRIKL